MSKRWNESVEHSQLNGIDVTIKETKDNIEPFEQLIAPGHIDDIQSNNDHIHLIDSFLVHNRNDILTDTLPANDEVSRIVVDRESFNQEKEVSERDEVSELLSMEQVENSDDISPDDGLNFLSAMDIEPSEDLDSTNETSDVD